MATLGTLLYTWMHGEQVGTDEFGNRYYQAKNPDEKLHNRRRRWVVFKGKPDSTTVPAEWHAWLHHTSAEPLTEAAATSRDWQQPHRPNLTGTVAAYRPKGHDLAGGQRAHATGDYEPWVPE